MTEDVYSLIEEQYSSLVRDFEKCQESVNQLNARLDQHNVRLAEFVHNIHKLRLTEVIALDVAVKDLLRAVRNTEEQLDDADAFGK